MQMGMQFSAFSESTPISGDSDLPFRPGCLSASGESNRFPWKRLMFYTPIYDGEEGCLRLKLRSTRQFENWQPYNFLGLSLARSTPDADALDLRYNFWDTIWISYHLKRTAPI